MDLDGETIIVTGASSGIGAARLFAADGANVMLGAGGRPKTIPRSSPSSPGSVR